MRLSGHREKGSSHKRGLQFTPVYLLFAFSLLKRFLGFDHRGQFWSLVHSRPHPAATATELQGHILPLSVQLRVRTSPALSGPPVGRPGVFWVHLIQIQGSFWVWVAGAWRRRLGFATWAQRRPRWRWRRVRRRWSGRDAIGRCTSAGHFKSFPSSLPSSPSVSVFTWGTRSCFKKRDGRQGRQNNTYRHRKQSTCNKQREEQTGEHELGGVKENRKHRIIIPLHVSVHVERTEEKKLSTFCQLQSNMTAVTSSEQTGGTWQIFPWWLLAMTSWERGKDVWSFEFSSQHKLLPSAGLNRINEKQLLSSVASRCEFISLSHSGCLITGKKTCDYLW